jgi:hypothetical protein
MSLLNINMPNNFKTKLALVTRDRDELGASILAAKTECVQQRQALQELNTLADLCRTTGEGVVNDLDLGDLLRPAPDTDGSPLQVKEAIRFKIYSLLAATALMQEDYREIKRTFRVAHDIMNSQSGAMTPAEQSKNIPRTLTGHIGEVCRHVLRDDDQEDQVESDVGDHEGVGLGLDMVPFTQPSPSTRFSRMR